MCTLEKYSLFFLQEHELHYSIRTYENYKNNLDVHIIPFFKNKKLKNISRQDILDFQKIMLNKNLSTKTINKCLGILGRVLNFSKEGTGFQKQIKKSPYENIKMLHEKEFIAKTWTKKYAFKFLKKYQDNKLFGPILVALNTGMRLGEIAALKREDIMFEQNLILVAKSLNFTSSKGYIEGETKSKRLRYVVLNKALKEYFMKKFKNEDIKYKERVFKFEPHHACRDLKRLCRKINIPAVRFHDLRHTYASLFMAHNGNIFDLQKLLGHSDIETTMIYAHFSCKEIKKNSNRVIFYNPS